MDPKFVDYLSKLPLFSAVPRPALEVMTADAQVRQLEKGEVLVKKGAPGESLFVIRSGWVKVIADGEDGKELILNQVGPGQIVGEGALLDRSPRSNTVMAISPVQVLEISYDGFDAALSQSPDLARAFMANLFERLEFANLYLEQVIHWSQAIAAGDYSSVQDQIQTKQATIVDMSQSNEVRIGAFLSAFFKMVENVKKREDTLKEQLMQFEIVIDKDKKAKAVDELEQRSFFFRVKSAAHELRQRRQQDGDDDTSEPTK